MPTPPLTDMKKLSFLYAFSLCLYASSSFGQVNVLHHWTMGDAEGGTAGGSAAATLLDIEAGVNLSLTGTPVYGLLGGLGVDFANEGSAHNVPATAYYASAEGDVSPTDPARWGIEAIVRIDVLPAENQELAVFELGAGSGGIILQTFGKSAWAIHRSGVAITSDPNPVLVGQTQHLAAVLNAGSWQLWVDGALAASFLDPGYDPAAGIRIGAGDAGTGVNRGFNGIIETVRIFEYDGEFDINDTLVGVPSAPFVITGFEYLAGASEATVTWNSVPETFYSVDYSDTLQGPWIEAADGILGSAGATTSFKHVFNPPVAVPTRFYRVRTGPLP